MKAADFPIFKDLDPVHAARRRALTAYAAWALGLLAAGELAFVPAAWWFAGAMLALAAAVLTRGWLCRAALILAVVLAAAGWLAVRVWERPAHGLDRLAALGQADLTLEGVVLEVPSEPPAPAGAMASFAPRTARVRFLLRTERAWRGEEEIPVSGVAVVSVQGVRRLDLRAGQRALARGILSPPGLSDDGPRRAWAVARSGVDGHLRVQGPAGVEGLAQGSGTTAALAWLRARARAAADAATLWLDPPGRALVLGLVLGEVDPELAPIRADFMRLGLTHVLTISGFHLSVLAMLVVLALRLLGRQGPLEPLLVAALVGAYMLVVPAQSPVVRAGAMVLLLLLADASGRRYDRPTLLIWIALGLLVWRPTDLWSLGYQLSVGLTLALLWLAVPFHHHFLPPPLVVPGRPGPAPLERGLRWLAALCTSSLLCWVLSLPLLIARTGAFSPLTVVGTVLLTPLIVPLLCLGYAALAVGIVWPRAAAVMGLALRPLAAGTMSLSGAMASWPWSTLRLPPVGWLWALLATLLAVYWCVRGRWKDRAAWAGAAVLLVWLMLGAQGLRRSTALHVDALPVGDGACYLLCSGGEAALWNCGSSWPDAGARAIVPELRRRGVWRVPRVVLSRPRYELFSALLDVAEPLGVRRVDVAPAFEAAARKEPRGPEAFVLSELRRRGVEVHAVEESGRFMLGEAAVDVIAPPKDAQRPWTAAAPLQGRLTLSSRSILILDHAGLAAQEPRSSPDAVFLSLPTRERTAEVAAALRPAAIIESGGHAGAGRSAALPPGSWRVSAGQGVRVGIKPGGGLDVGPVPGPW